jgi:hypothetical protein
MLFVSADFHSHCTMFIFRTGCEATTARDAKAFWQHHGIASRRGHKPNVSRRIPLLGQYLDDAEANTLFVCSFVFFHFLGSSTSMFFDFAHLVALYLRAWNPGGPPRIFIFKQCAALCRANQLPGVV